LGEIKTDQPGDGPAFTISDLDLTGVLVDEKVDGV